MGLDVELVSSPPGLDLLYVLLLRTHLVNGPRRLVFLRMQGIDFYDGVSTLGQLVEMETLEDLQLIGCPNYSHLLSDLKRLRLDLKAFRIHEYDMGEKDFEVDANEFIRSLSSLNRVSLTLDPDFDLPGPHNLLDWSALGACASTLKYLRMESYSIESPFPCRIFASNFAVLCRLATNLEQLAISGVDIEPETSDDASKDTSFRGISHFLVGHD